MVRKAARPRRTGPGRGMARPGRVCRLSGGGLVVLHWAIGTKEANALEEAGRAPIWFPSYAGRDRRCGGCWAVALCSGRERPAIVRFGAGRTPG